MARAATKPDAKENVSAKTMPEVEASVLIGWTKSASPSENWGWSATNAWTMGFGVVCDPPRRGMTVELYCVPGTKIPQAKMNLGLWDKSDGDFRRVYQLTVAPSHLSTHTEDGVVWYGSHEHIGAAAYRLPYMDAYTFPQALEYFLQRTTLTLEDPISDPYALKLK